MLFSKCIFGGPGIGISPQPEIFYKTLALFIALQVFENGFFLIGNDIADVLIKPLLVKLRLSAFLPGNLSSGFFSSPTCNGYAYAQAEADEYPD